MGYMDGRRDEFTCNCNSLQADIGIRDTRQGDHYLKDFLFPQHLLEGATVKPLTWREVFNLPSDIDVSTCH